MARAFALFFLSLFGSSGSRGKGFLFLWVKTVGDNVDGTIDNNDKRVKGEPVERVDLEELIHKEEDKSTSVGCGTILL